MVFALTMTGTETSERTQRSDDQLMLAYARGDKAAFDQLYGRYKQPIYNYLYRNCRRQPTVEEIFQDVWLKLISASKRYQTKDRFRQWLFTLAHNCLVDYYRRAEKERLRDEMPEDIEAMQLATERQANDTETSEAIRLAILALPDDQRQAFWLREESGFSIKEIAEIQEITTEAAKSRLRYAYQKLRQQLEELSQ